VCPHRTGRGHPHPHRWSRPPRIRRPARCRRARCPPARRRAGQAGWCRCHVSDRCRKVRAGISPCLPGRGRRMVNRGTGRPRAARRRMEVRRSQARRKAVRPTAYPCHRRQRATPSPRPAQRHCRCRRFPRRRHRPGHRLHPRRCTVRGPVPRRCTTHRCPARRPRSAPRQATPRQATRPYRHLPYPSAPMAPPAR
jgi:hypothetical protein